MQNVTLEATTIHSNVLAVIQPWNPLLNLHMKWTLSHNAILFPFSEKPSKNLTVPYGSCGRNENS